MPEPIVGFIGLGVMGRPMAGHLLGAGYPVVVHSRTSSTTAALLAGGALPASSPIEVARRCEVVITMLPNTADVESVYRGPTGLLAGAREGHLFIDMSSIAAPAARELAAEAGALGAYALDAPVSGGDVGAAEGTLSIMVGGPEEAFHRALPVLRTLGSTVIHVGDAGAGQTAKSCNQVAVALIIEAISEALVLGSKAGIDPARLAEVLAGGLAANRVLDVRARKMLEHDFSPGARVDLHHKDLGHALGIAREFGVSLPVTALVDDMFQELQAAGHGDWDHTSLLAVIEERSAHRIGPSASAG
jgi:2-hydroxy-3-oxopropionate reductase